MKTYPENSFCANIKLKHKGEKEREKEENGQRRKKDLVYRICM